MFRSSYRICTVFGIPIKLHISLLLLFPLLVLLISGNNAQLNRYIPIDPHLFSAFLALGLFVSVALHELGHSLVGIKCGYRIKEIVLLPIGGVAKISRMTESHWHEIMVAIAGPAVSLTLSGLFYAAAAFSALALPDGFAIYFMILSAINLVLALFNLLPSFPMDGGRVLRAALTPRLGALEATRRAAKVGRTLAFLFGVYSLFRGSLWNLLIAIFIYRAAGAEYRIKLMQEKLKSRFGWDRPSPAGERSPPPPPPSLSPENKISVGPPPYKR